MSSDIHSSNEAGAGADSTSSHAPTQTYYSDSYLALAQARQKLTSLTQHMAKLAKLEIPDWPLPIYQPPLAMPTGEAKRKPPLKSKSRRKTKSNAGNKPLRLTRSPQTLTSSPEITTYPPLPTKLPAPQLAIAPILGAMFHYIDTLTSEIITALGGLEAFEALRTGERGGIADSDNFSIAAMQDERRQTIATQLVELYKANDAKLQGPSVFFTPTGKAYVVAWVRTSRR